MKKYELTKNMKMLVSSTGEERFLTQIRAVNTFTLPTGFVVKAGSLGGWIQTEDNLSQEGACWLDEQSEALNQSHIRGDAFIESSSLFDSSTAIENVHIKESILADNAFVCGRSKVQNSHIYGNSLLGGYCVVFQSNLTNVRTKVGTEDKTTWGNYYFNDVELTAEPQLGAGLEILSDCHWSHVELSGKQLKIHAKTRFHSVQGSDLTLLLVEQPLTMKQVFLHDKSSIRVRGDKALETSICGNEGIPDKDWVQIDSANLLLQGAQISDNVFIKGKWILTGTKLSGYATLVNEWSHQHLLASSTVKELANVFCPFDYTGGTVSKTLLLQGDEQYQIA